MLAHGVFFVLSLVGITTAGNTTCLNSSMDWFTQSVGESPCQVYERLRATCSPGFQVGNMPNTAPGDTCGDQVAACCCNTVSFALSMLCMSCQWGIGSGVNQDFGFDAPPGTYAKYLSGCGPIVNQTLPDAVQMATCNQNIKIPSYVYNPEWHTDGSWFFYYTRQTAELQIKSGQNETGKCADLLLKASASSSSIARATQSFVLASSTSSPSSSKASPLPVGAIVGGVLGGIALLVGGVLAGYFFSQRRAKRNVVDLVDENDKEGIVYAPYTINHPGPAPAQFPAPTTHGAGSTGWTYTDASSSNGGYAASPLVGSAPTLAPAPVPHRQKGGMVPETQLAGSRTDVGPSQPLFSHRNSSEGSQVGPRTSTTTELPPSYEPRRQ